MSKVCIMKVVRVIVPVVPSASKTTSCGFNDLAYLAFGRKRARIDFWPQ